MTFRITIKQIPSGEWAHFSGKRSCWVNTVRPTENEARIAALHRIGQEAQERIDAVDRELKKLGAYVERDPHGYLA